MKKRFRIPAGRAASEIWVAWNLRWPALGVNFGGQEYYLTAEGKAAAILETILLNHPFVDGNKRTGYTLMLLTLNKHGLDLQVHDDEQYDFVVSVASGKLPFEEIVTWIRNAVGPK